MKIRTKILGSFSVMLAVLLLYLGACYLLTKESIDRIEHMRGEISERKQTLEARHLFIKKMAEFSNYCLYMREGSMENLGYAEKAFEAKLDALEAQLLKFGNPEQLALLGMIRKQDKVHHQVISRFAKTYETEGKDMAVSRDLKNAEQAEDAIMSGFDGIGKETRSFIAAEEKGYSLTKKFSPVFPSFAPIIEARTKILDAVDGLWTDLELDDLGHRQYIASRRFLLKGGAEYVSDYEKLEKMFNLQVDTALSSKYTDAGPERNVLNEVKGLNKTISANFFKAVCAYRSGDAVGAEKTVLHSFMDEEMMDSRIDDKYDMEMKQFESTYAALPPLMNYALSFIRQLFVLLSIVAVIGFLAVSAFIRSMIKPINMLNRAAQKIADGDWGQRVAVSTRDEIGEMASSFNKMTGYLERAEKELIKRHLELSALYSVSSIVSRTMDMDKLLADVLKAVTEAGIFNIENRGGIFILDGGRMRLASHLGSKAEFLELHKRMEADGCLCGLAARTGEVVISKNALEDDGHAICYSGMSPHGRIIVPLKAKEKVVGVLYLYMKADAGVEEEKIKLLLSIGNQVGIAIENARLYEETKALSLHDPLTGLANRRFMDIMLERNFARARRSETPFSVIMLDVDYFKKYNDTYGHPAGDKLLSEAAKILLGEVREVDFVARYGGEEFVLLLPEANPLEAYRVAERTRKAFETGVGVTISLGVATYNPRLQKMEDIIKKADDAMYQAKERGRNRVEVADSAPPPLASGDA